MNKNLIKIIITLANLFLAFSIVIYTFYRRILFVRIPKTLYFINDGQINYTFGILIFMSSIFCVFIVIINIKVLSKKTITISTLSRISIKLNNIVDNALQELYQVVVMFLFNDPAEKVSNFSALFYKYFKNFSNGFLLFVLFSIRIIILICFLIDVFIYFRFNYMYKSLYLLCIVLVIKIMLYLLKGFTTNLEDLTSYLNIQDNGLDPNSELPVTSYTLKEEYKDLDLFYHVEQYILCLKITGYLEYYDKYVRVLTPYFNIIIYTLYLSGWLYILYLNLSVT